MSTAEKKGRLLGQQFDLQHVNPAEGIVLLQLTNSSSERRCVSVMIRDGKYHEWYRTRKWLAPFWHGRFQINGVPKGAEIFAKQSKGNEVLFEIVTDEQPELISHE